MSDTAKADASASAARAFPPGAVLVPAERIGIDNAGRPCGGKRPAGEWKDVTASTWTESDGGGACILTEQSGLLVLDADGAEGLSSLAALEAEIPFPRTYRVRSGGGGVHVYFRAPPGDAIGSSTNKLAPKLDVKAGRGVIVATGSPHVSGGIYKVVDLGSDGGAFVADLPPALVVRLQALGASVPKASDTPGHFDRSHRPDPEKRAKAVEALAAVWPAKGAGRHPTQLALAGALARMWPAPEVLEFLCDLCRAVGDEDRPKREATVRDTFAALDDGRPVTGWPELEKKLGAEVTSQVEAWLRECPHCAPNLAEFTEWRKEVAAENGTGSEPMPDDADAFLADLGAVAGGWDKPVPPPDYLVERLLVRGEVAMFAGKGGSLKTWLVYELARAVESGTSALGAYPAKQGRVLVLDFETGKGQFHRRTQILKAGAAPDLMLASHPEARTDDPKFWKRLANLVTRKEIALVVIDSLISSSPGVDENDARAAVPLMFARKFAEATGCVVVVIHHEGKGKADDARDAVRGSSAILSQTDRVFRVQSLKDPAPGVKVAKVGATRCQNGVEPEPFTIQLSDARGLELASPSVEDRTSSQARVLEAIRAAEVAGQPLRSLEDIGGKKQETSSVVQKLAADGAIVKLAGAYLTDSDDKRKDRVVRALLDLAELGHKVTSEGLARKATVPKTLVERFEKDGDIRGDRSKHGAAAQWLATSADFRAREERLRA